jgi:hypothetical protein
MKTEEEEFDSRTLYRVYTVNDTSVTGLAKKVNHWLAWWNKDIDGIEYEMFQMTPISVQYLKRDYHRYSAIVFYSFIIRK